MLDIDLGTYPYVTSSSPTAGGACTGSGIPPSRVTKTVGRVQGVHDPRRLRPVPHRADRTTLGDQLREVGAEYGTTTGRARRVGWFDAAVSRYAVATNGIDAMVLTKVDVLDEFETLRICTGYMSKGEYWDHPMANISHLKHVDPIYEEFPGWMSPTRECRRYEDLPAACRTYIERVGELCGASVNVVSVGPGSRAHAGAHARCSTDSGRGSLKRSEKSGRGRRATPCRSGRDRESFKKSRPAALPSRRLAGAPTTRCLIISSCPNTAPPANPFAVAARDDGRL